MVKPELIKDILAYIFEDYATELEPGSWKSMDYSGRTRIRFAHRAISRVLSGQSRKQIKEYLKDL